MAIEPLKIGSAAPSLNRLDKPQNNNVLDINNVDKKETKETEKDNKSEKEDKVTLSEEALVQLKQTENLSETQEVKEISNEDLQKLKENQKSLENDLIEFRGFNEVAKRRDLTAEDFTKISELRSNIKNSVGDQSISDEKILDKADEVVSEIVSETQVLLDKLKTGNITGNQFDKLDKINTSFNKANGFGNSFEPEATQDTTQIRKDFSKSLEDIGDRKLSEKEIAILQQAQRQFSAIEGFRVNVRDKEIVGSEGIVA